MAGCQIIADVSRCLLRRVQDAVCPDLLPHLEQVSLCAPYKKDSEAVLGISLYGIRDFCAFQPEGRASLFENSIYAPPKAISLLYLVYLSAHAQTPVDAMTEQRILGRVIQLLHTTPTVEIAAIHAEADAGDLPASISFQKLEERQKQEIWSGFSEPVRPALYFEAGPLLIRAEKQEVTRVRAAESEVSHR